MKLKKCHSLLGRV